jgi:hypothetical protein
MRIFHTPFSFTGPCILLSIFLSHTAKLFSLLLLSIQSAEQYITADIITVRSTFLAPENTLDESLSDDLTVSSPVLIAGNTHDSIRYLYIWTQCAFVFPVIFAINIDYFPK